MKARHLSAILLATLVVGWLVLFFSGRGILVWFSQPEQRLGLLKCEYFTGTGIVERQFLYTEHGPIGRDNCPRVLDVTK